MTVSSLVGKILCQRQSKRILSSFSLSASSSSFASFWPTCASSSHLTNTPTNITSVSYSTTKSCSTIYKVNSDLSDEQIEKLMEAEMIQEETQKQLQRGGGKDWKPGYPKRPLQVSFHLQDFLQHPNESSSRWNPTLHRRTGLLAIKVGMMPVWDDWGERHACTILYVDHNVVLQVKKSNPNYIAVQIGAGERKKKNVTKPLLGHYQKCLLDIVADGEVLVSSKGGKEEEQEEEENVTTRLPLPLQDKVPWDFLQHPPYIVREFRLTDMSYLPKPGTLIHARHFVPGQNVDVAGITKGKGFQGGMKLHGFAGLGASHGVSVSHRAIGSTGSCQDPGRVWKGKKMPGRMGGVRRTAQNLRILKIDRGRNLIYIKGSIPGNNGEFVEVRDSVKRPLFGTKSVLGYVPDPTLDLAGSSPSSSSDSGANVLDTSVQGNKLPPLPTFQYDSTIDGSGLPGFEEMMPLADKDPFAPNMEESPLGG